MGEAAHPIRDLPGLDAHVGLVRAEKLAAFPIPWPRHQDLGSEAFASPTKDDLVVAVSHAWQYQVHADPTGGTSPVIQGLVSEAVAVHRPRGRPVLFHDFLSVPQRPFAAGQEERTPDEQAAFSAALKIFPHIYLMADAAIHFEVSCDPVAGDGEIYMASTSDLDGLETLTIGDHVQVVSWPDASSRTSVVPFDGVLFRDGKKVTSAADLRRAQNRDSGAQPLFAPWWWACTSCVSDESPVTMQRAPYGRRNTVPARLKGWVYLERFVSMVKAAMVPESQVSSVAFSDNPQVLEEIFGGGRRLRAAAAGGQQRLQEVLREFALELDSKHFSATSIDKAQNTGGVGGHASVDNQTPDDKEVVLGLMEELVQHLVQHWERELKAQQQRQLVLAVSRGDARAVKDLLAAGADPNLPDSLGVASLHVAAKFRHLEVGRLLLGGGASPSAQDVLGNCPAHMVPLLSDAQTVPMFRLVAPTQQELTLRNTASVTPLRRFQVWATLELASKPFPEATACLDELRQRYPKAFEPTARRKGVGPVGVDIKDTQVAYQVSGRDVNCTVMQPASGQHDLDVVCLNLSFFVPPKMGEAAIRSVAQLAGSASRARFFCVSADALSPTALAAESIQPLHEELLQIIAALPLRKPYLLVDSSLGEATPLLWRLQDDLAAALVLNLRGFMSDEFPTSDICPKVVKRFSNIGGFFADRNAEQLAGMYGDYAFAASPEDLQKQIDAYKAGVRQAPAAFFEYGALHCRMVAGDVMQWTQMYKSLGSLARPHVVLACGAFSPAMWTLEAAPRLGALIRSSAVEHIPDDKSCWELEGVESAAAVADILCRLIDDCSPKVYVPSEIREGPSFAAIPVTGHL